LNGSGGVSKEKARRRGSAFAPPHFLPRGSLLTDEPRPPAESNHRINGIVDRPIARLAIERAI
jgi:hypothetical protein